MSSNPFELDRARRFYKAPRLGVAWRRYVRSTPVHALLILIAVLFLIPYYVLVRNALMTRAQITSFDWIWLPIPPHFENIREAFNNPAAPLLNGLNNSAFIATSQVGGQLLFASLAGYGLARIPFRWRNLVLYFILVTLMVPNVVIFVPTYIVVARLGWVNTYQGIIVPGLFSAFATFLFRQFYLDFPKEIEEAGLMDGLGYLGIYRHLVLPNSLGILISLGVINFVFSWNAFLWPLVIGQDASMWTVQVVLSTFITAQTINLPGLFMSATISIIPVLLVFIFLQRYLVEGVRLSGIKG